MEVMESSGIEHKWLALIDKLFSLGSSFARRLIVLAIKM